jgi:hypothetical protein
VALYARRCVAQLVHPRGGGSSSRATAVSTATGEPQVGPCPLRLICRVRVRVRVWGNRKSNQFESSPKFFPYLDLHASGGSTDTNVKPCRIN